MCFLYVGSSLKWINYKFECSKTEAEAALFSEQLFFTAAVKKLPISCQCSI